MSEQATLGEVLLGVAGLAMLRQTSTGDVTTRGARVDEMRSLLDRFDGEPELTAPVGGQEYDLTEGYALWSETYDQPLRLFPIEHPTMCRLIDTLRPGDVIDAACGTGRYSEYLAARGHKVIGIDQSTAMLAKARQKVPSAEFHEGDLEALPVEDGSADAVVCALALVHLDALDRAMAEFARILRAGGRVIISDVHPFPILLGWQAQFRTAGGDTGFMRIHPHLLSDYCTAGNRAGLRINACFEPLLTPESAVTPAAERLPEANRAAWVDLPGVVIWEFEKV